MKYLIYSRDDLARGRDGTILWWRANAAGYTDDLSQAGRYSEEQAVRICGTDQRHQEMVPETLAVGCSKSVAWTFAHHRDLLKLQRANAVKPQPAKDSREARQQKEKQGTP